MDPYSVLGLDYPCNKEDIKIRYHELARKHHPDKLQHLSKKEIDIHEQEFKRISVAYEMLSKRNYEHIDMNMDKDDWNKMWENIPIFNDPDFMNDILQNVINGVKKYATASNNEHYITIDVSLEEVFQKKDKKLRLFLKNIPDPIFININCSSYPFLIYTYDENINIHITFNLSTEGLFSLDTLFESNDIFCTIHISLYEYIKGCTKHLQYLDNTVIDIKIQPCSEETIEIPNKGLNYSGKLTIFIKTILPSKALVDTLESSKKATLYKYLKKISCSHHSGKSI